MNNTKKSTEEIFRVFEANMKTFDANKTIFFIEVCHYL